MLKSIKDMTEHEIVSEIKLRERRLQMLGLVPCTDPSILKDEKDPHTRVFLRAKLQPPAAPAMPAPSNPTQVPNVLATPAKPKRPERLVQTPDTETLRTGAGETPRIVRPVTASNRFLRIRRS